MATIKKEAERCLKCKKPMCAAHCPVNTPIPDVMDMVLEGKIMEAGEMLFYNNPMSTITSIVCPHQRNCYGHCVLGKKSEPVKFYEVEQYVSGLYLFSNDFEPVPSNGKKIAVIGGGPSGITVSLFMAARGYQVTLFEAEGDIGGALRYGIPEFRLAKNILERYREILDHMGVKVRTNVRIDAMASLEDFFMDGYKGVFIGVGTGRPNRLGLLGETLGHVHYAVDFLKSPRTHKLGKKVAIVGAGNVAMDAARVAIRAHHSEVTMLNYRNADEMSADPLEIEMAEVDGVKFIHNTQAVRIEDDGVTCVEVDRIENEDGTVSYVENYEKKHFFKADNVIIAIGQGPGADFKAGHDVETTKRGLIQVNEFGETNTPNVWAAGEIVTGPGIVVQVVQNALKVAQNMYEKLERIKD